MRLRGLFLVAASLGATARAITIRITITGTTRGAYVVEGPVFGFSSGQKIPDGTGFTLTYTFDDTKGSESYVTRPGDGISQSAIRAALQSSPGTDAALQIGSSIWEFGESTDSEVRLKAFPGDTSEFIHFATADDNSVSSLIYPASGEAWPGSADWRESFTASPLKHNPSSFSVDNGTVAAKGELIPASIEVEGVHCRGQWLTFTTSAGGPEEGNWLRRWNLAQPSPKGGYVVEHVTRHRVGARTADGAPITPPEVSYWVAWAVIAGAQGTTPSAEDFTPAVPPGSSGTDTILATARFYEGLTLPSTFAAGNSPYAGPYPSTTVDPNLSTGTATLPVVVTATLHF
jgi:hypothetical protein